MPNTSLTSHAIRQQFIDYFREKHAHTFVPSSPVVPHDDPTLLFTNAGMNQFKDVFLATGSRDYQRAVNSQKCIRAGGKHNDLEDVGKDTYHHTFFEMLGNWSFGDYFKTEAIDWAWELLTEVWGLDPTRLHATYFEGDADDGLEPDDEARELWLRHLPAERVHPGNKKDNFWEMGDTGPCGPCSEIHYDATDDKTGAALVNADDPRVIEIWNLVFIQFNRASSGKLSPLPARHVDTGMGFERIVAVLQGKRSNYDTDVFQPLFEAIQQVTGARPYGKDSADYAQSLRDPIDVAYRVIADHIRCLTFALTDGAVPSNEGRGYVLRRILRRAVRHGRQTLGVHEPFLYKLVEPVAQLMGEAFSELKQKPDFVAGLIRDEEESFGRTIDRGIALFDMAYADVIGRAYQEHVLGQPTVYTGTETVAFWEESESETEALSESAKGLRFLNKETNETFNVPTKDAARKLGESLIAKLSISGDSAFKLYDTYGFPLDLTQVMAEERGMAVDVDRFNELMEQQRAQSRAATGSADARQSLVELVQHEKLPATEFLGYNDTVEAEVDSPVLLFAHREEGGYQKVDHLSQGMHGALVVERTPFYAEAGGQVGDRGIIEIGQARFVVEDTLKFADTTFHLGAVEAGSIEAAGKAHTRLRVDADRRRRIAANHTATHMLNRALRVKVNPEADQKGSLVDDQKLRFDFSQRAAVGPEQIERVEQMVRNDVELDYPVYANEAPQKDALRISGLRAVFGEKYPDPVRVVSIGVPVDKLVSEPEKDEWRNYSIEFCGGTHLNRTSDAEEFVIIGEEAVAKGVRRITALTGAAARDVRQHGQSLLKRLDALKSAGGADEQHLRTDIAELSQAINAQILPATLRNQLNAGLAELQRTLKDLDKQRSQASAATVVDEARRVADESDGELIVARFDEADGNALRTAMDVMRKKRPEAALLLAGVADDKVALVAAVPQDKIDRGLKAGDWVKEAAKVVGGGGGGKPDMAQAGGKDPSKLDEALDAARTFAQSKL